MLKSDKVLFSALVALTIGAGSLECAEKKPQPQPTGCAANSAFSKKSTAFVTGEYLYWHPYENGLGYVLQDSIANETSSNRKIAPHFQWDSGFRVGIGGRLPHDVWELSVKWTRFLSTAKGQVFGTPGGTLFPQFTVATVPGFAVFAPITEINAKWNLHLNLLDGEIARGFRATQFLILRPHGGVRGAWIKQNYKINTFGGLSVFSSVPVIEDNLSMSIDFKGVGLRAGLDSTWRICYGLSLYGNTAVSLLYGTAPLKAHDVTSFTASPTGIQDTKISQHQIKAMLDLAAGIQWAYLFSNKRTALKLAIGWEFNDFFDQNIFLTPILSQGAARGNGASVLALQLHEDLTTQGLVVSARLDF